MDKSSHTAPGAASSLEDFTHHIHFDAALPTFSPPKYQCGKSLTGGTQADCG
jgi:hypothetical protein